MIRSLVLFAHVVGVLGLFVGLGVEWLSLDAVRRAAGRAEAQRWARVSDAVPRVSGAALAVILTSGLYLGARVGVLGDGWMRASYGALLLMAAVGGPVARPSLRTLRHAAQTSGDGTVESLRTAASSAILRVSVRLRVAFGLAVIYLMIAKPDTAASLVALALAAVATIAASLPGRAGHSALVEGYR